MSDRPLAFIDVDGVLNVLAFNKALKRGMTFHRMTLSNGNTYPIRLRPEFHGGLLKDLEMAGFDLAWGTTWENDANIHIAPHLGLPVLPVAAVSARHDVWPEVLPKPKKFSERALWNWKSIGILALAGDRPFVWFDDDLSRADHAWARERSATVPTKLIKINPREGLMTHHIRRAKEWQEANRLGDPLAREPEEMPRLMETLSSENDLFKD